MTPLGAVTLGLLVVLLDLRLSGVDVLADVVGWVVAVGGLGRLTAVDARFGRARDVGVLAGLLSLADLVHPQVTTTSADAFSSTTSTTSTVAPGGLHGVLVSLYGVAIVVVAVLLCLALRDRARRYGDIPLAERCSLFAFLHVVVGVLVLGAGLLVLMTGEGTTIPPQGGAAGLTFVLVVGALLMEVWFLATLAGARHRRWLQVAEPDVRETSPQE